MISRQGRTLQNVRDEYVRAISKYRRMRKEEMAKVRHMSAKIKAWKRQIRNIDAKRAKIKQVAKVAEDLTGIGIRVHGKNVGAKMTKYLFYTYCLEHKFHYPELIEVTGVKRKGHPAEYRKEFRASFRTSKMNKKLWDEFCFRMKSKENIDGTLDESRRSTNNIHTLKGVDRTDKAI